MIDSNNELKKLSKSLLEAARGIIENRTTIERKTDQELSEAAKVLTAKQKKIDKNHNGKLDAEDFAKLRAEGIDHVIIHSPYTPDIHGGIAEVTHRDRRNGNVSVMFENMKYVLKKGQFKEIPEEAEELDELSQKMVRAYRDKARDDKETAEDDREFYKSHDDNVDHEDNIIRKRKAGIKTATYKILGGAKVNVKEEAEELDELSKGAMLKYLSANKKDDTKARETGDYDKMTKRMRGTDMAVRKYTAKPGSKSVRVPATEEVELGEAPVDGVAAGSMNNDGHLCATKVFHKEWAEGAPLFSQHAEPDADGNIAWYDVMFEHGIEKMVSTDDLDILMSESHERHGKRKMKEDVEAIDEISNTTLSSYTDKAAKERDVFHADRNKTADAARKYFNRKNGVRKALQITKEEAENIDEATKRTYVGTVGDWHIHHSEDPGSGEDRYHFKHKTTGKSGGYLQINPYHNTAKETHAQSVQRQAKSWGASDEESKLIVNHQNKLLGKNEEVEHIDESAKIAAHLVKRYGDNVRKSHVMSAANDFGVDPSKLAKAVRKKLGVNSLDEARGRRRKNPIPAGQSEEPEPRQHIMQQLQRAKLSMRGGEHVTFKDGTKHHISGDNAATILAKYSGMRPAQKEEFQKKIGSSHAAFKEEL